MARCLVAITVAQVLSSTVALIVPRALDNQVPQEAGTPLVEQFRGLRVAVAWHGFYNRDNAPHIRYGTCSDFFHVAPNINAMVTGPLVRAGATVSHYVHTYNRLDCPAKDAKLLAQLQPVRHAFWNDTRRRIVDSYIEVLNMVMEDKDSIDFVLLLRFDVGYASPITAWNMTLDTVGVPFFSHNGRDGIKTSDLLYTSPIKYVPHLAYALDQSGNRCGRGAGHLTYGPLAKRIGESNVRVMDYRAISSAREFNDMKSFLGIDRNCGSDYYAGCPAAIPAPIAR